MIKWKEAYAVGIPLVDEQHKKLFDIAGEAQELLGLSENIDKFDEIIALINELKDYVVFHFAAEQELMEQIKYPKYLSHRVEHDDLIAEINKLNLEAVDNNQQQHLTYIVNLMIEWIVEHVLKRDKIMAAYYKEVNGKS